MSQLNSLVKAQPNIAVARTIAGLAAGKEIQSAHLAEALHAWQSPEVDNRVMKNTSRIVYRYKFRLVLVHTTNSPHIGSSYLLLNPASPRGAVDVRASRR